MTDTDLLLAASAALSGDGVWSFDDQPVIRNEIAHAVLGGVPDGFAKIRGQWVRLTDEAQRAAMGKGFWPATGGSMSTDGESRSGSREDRR